MSLSEVEISDQRAVEFFNERHPVGTPIRFWPGIKDGEGILSRTRSAAQLLSGDTPVVWVEDYAGCIALTHVQVVGQPEPTCCGDPMIHNSFTGQYECSVAYLVLHDEGIDPYLVDPADLEPAQRAQHAHWMASRRSDDAR